MAWLRPRRMKSVTCDPMVLYWPKPTVTKSTHQNHFPFSLLPHLDLVERVSGPNCKAVARLVTHVCAFDPQSSSESKLQTRSIRMTKNPRIWAVPSSKQSNVCVYLQTSSTLKIHLGGWISWKAFELPALVLTSILYTDPLHIFSQSQTLELVVSNIPIVLLRHQKGVVQKRQLGGTRWHNLIILDRRPSTVASGKAQTLGLKELKRYALKNHLTPKRKNVC